MDSLRVMSDPDVAAIRARREPPELRLLTVRRTVELSPRLVRVTIGGPALDGFQMPEPAASVRLLLPAPGDDTIALPTWDGNEFRNADGSRPALRTLTPRHHRPLDQELDVDVVLHGDTPLAIWAATAEPGTPVAMSGPGRGYEIDPRATDFLLLGDESALPAIAQLLEHLPVPAEVNVLVEVAHPTGRLALPDRPGLDVAWLDQSDPDQPGAAIVEAVQAATISTDTHVWAAGEAAAVQAIRRHLFEERSLPRSRAVVRGYWKHGRNRPRSKP